MRTLFLFLIALVAQVAWGHTMTTTQEASSLATLTLTPNAVTGGSFVTGTVTLTEPAPAGGATVTLATSSLLTASVPANVVVPEGELSATFVVTTGTVTSPRNAMISGIYGGVAAYAMLAVNPVFTADAVTIQKAQYDAKKRVLNVEASTTGTTAILKVYEVSTGKLIGTLAKKAGRYSGRFSWSTDPVTIEVRSSQGGSATANTTR